MQATFNKALAFHQSGQLAQAEELYRQLLNQAPGHPILLARLGTLMCQSQRSEQGLALLAQAIAQSPQDAELLKQAIHLAAQAGETVQAELWLRQALKFRAGDSSLHEQLAGVLIANHKETEALDAIKTAIRLDPQNANAYNLKGLALSRLGDTEKGYECFLKSVKMNPGQLGAVKNLIHYGKGRKEPVLEQLIPQLELRLNQPGLQAMVQLNLGYMLAMYFEHKTTEKNSTEQQLYVRKHFDYLRRANDISRLQYQYSHADTEQYFTRWANAFTPSRIDEIRKRALDDASAIFILGMPRSGTTLIEQILASHSQVGAEGEILDLQQSVDVVGGLLADNLPDAVFAERAVAAVKLYLERVRSRQQAVHFTDKLPYNFIVTGLIASALPKAKIIHCTRDPLETCFSIYKQNFVGNHGYTNDQKELGQYFKAYQTLMKQWQARFPNAVYEANYERMVADPEHEIAQLLNYCELEPEEACFAFHKNKRAVRTASVAQVRQPIYKDALKASDPYRDFLQVLIAELDKV